MTDWSADEEARAALWRAEQVRRVGYQSQLWASLAGSPVAQVAFDAAWAPLIDYLAEREIDDAYDDDGDDPLFDPLGISDVVNVGRLAE